MELLVVMELLVGIFSHRIFAAFSKNINIDILRLLRYVINVYLNLNFTLLSKFLVIRRPPRSMWAKFGILV